MIRKKSSLYSHQAKNTAKFIEEYFKQSKYRKRRILKGFRLRSSRVEILLRLNKEIISRITRISKIHLGTHPNILFTPEIT